MASGGSRVPSQPAAVSGPGRFSARTDGGPAQMVAPGGKYGSRQQLESQQSAAPVPTDGNAAPAPQGGAGQGSGGSPMADPFGPTTRPNEPATAGMIGMEPDNEIDVDYALQQIYQRYPSPWIAGLMNGR